ncbi:MAG TPA: hypothetical protein PKA63_11940 [Oligoflexia bacterium]|nr:hypothetical protein [Oligoflexia bacterium]HMP49365.1 hypothetical protein [Oligoflexia bacterium]
MLDTYHLEDKYREEVLRGFAGRVRNSSFRVPLSFILESHVPAFTIIYSIFLVAEPFISPFVSSDVSLAFKLLNEAPEMRDWFLDEISSPPPCENLLTTSSEDISG